MLPSCDNPDVGTSRVDSRNSTDLPSARFVWGLHLICLAAFSISVYLAWTAFSMGHVFGCSAGEVIDCGHVLTSHWSKVMGIPVSVPAVGLYASLIALLTFARRKGPQSLRQLVWGGMTLGSVMAGVAALWFIALQYFVLKHYCPYCLVVHACGIVLAVTMLTSRLCPPALKMKSAGISVLGIAALAGIQAVTPKADQFEVVHYDDVLEAVNPGDDAVSSTEVFAAPGDVFEAPGEAFAAPGDVFEPPVAGDGAEGTSSAGKPDSTTPASRETNDGQPRKEQPSVASALLLIAPPRLLQLTHFCFMALPEAVDETPEPNDTVKADSAAQPSAEPSDDAAASNTQEETASGSTPAEKTETPAAEAPVVPERRLLTFAGNRFTLDIRQWPLLGKSDAKYVFVEMFDYTCPHCRNTHQAISGAQKKYGDDLAIFALPVPLENSCNPAATGGGHAGACEQAKIAIAVWRLNPEKFQEFHNWMFERQRTPSAARQFAETLVGKDDLQKELSSPIPGQYISRHVSLYQRVGSGQVPKLIFPATTMQGEVNSTVTLCNAIERELAVAKK